MSALASLFVPLALLALLLVVAALAALGKVADTRDATPGGGNVWAVR